MGQRLPVRLWPHSKQQDLHGPFTAQAKAPDEVVRAPIVVHHQLRPASLDHGQRALAQVPFEATAREQPGIVAVAGDQHQRTRLAVRGAQGVYEQAHRQGTASGTLAVEQREQGSEG